MQINDKIIKSLVSSTIYRRGLDYFRSGRVHLKQCSENEINAVVDGNQLYNVQIRSNDNGEIDYLFCSCPYFSSMNCGCKHIAAAAKQYQAEYGNTVLNVNTSDGLAEKLVSYFETETKALTECPFVFILNIITPKYKNDRGRYFIEMKNDTGHTINVVKFITAYRNGKEYKAGRTVIYSPEKHSISPENKKVIEFIAQIIENNTVYMPVISPYSTSQFHINIGALSAIRLLEFENIDLEILINSRYFNDIKMHNENPEIRVDINAGKDNINMSVADFGEALFGDGSWFLFKHELYRTDEEFRAWYMPIYNTFRYEHRKQADFRGESAVKFIRKVLPKINDKQGVKQSGLDIIAEQSEPVFSVYLDRYITDEYDGICAKINVSYGDVSFGLPEGNTGGRIVMRDSDKEAHILSYMKNFAYNGEYYILADPQKIYSFITERLPDFLTECEIYYSDAFKNVKDSGKANLSLSVNYNSDIDLLEMSFDADLDQDEIIGILSAIKEKKKYYRLKNGSFLNTGDNEELEMFDILLRLDFSGKDIKNGGKNLTVNNMLYLAEFDRVKFGREFSEKYESLRNIKADIPEYLTGILRGYQTEGVNWFAQLSAFGFGGILADDMGLGKTLQVIAFVCSRQNTLPVLIVTPSSLTYNWQNEINKFTPSKTSVIIEGNKSERIFRLGNCHEYDFVITSYPLLRRDIEEYENLEFEYCFIDEAQHIKNPRTKNAESVKAINARHKFALTGTPIENSLTELWSIFDFLMPGYLYSINDFAEKFEKPILKGNSGARNQLKAKIGPFIMRRMKDDVLDELPEKIESVIYAELTSEQKRVYAAYMALAKNKFIELSDSGYSKNKIEILALLTRLRQICCHPVLFDDAYKKESGKLLLLEELLSEALASGHRVIVFSQFTSMLEIIKEKLEQNSISYFYLSGKTPSAVRADMAERFNGGENDVFLISLKAGGTGLNLIGADTVIHYDPWWNPAVMEQASDRAYRIGQKRNVQIIKLVSKGTIEEKIIMLQEKKKSLADGVITSDGLSFGSLTKADITALLS